MKILPNGIAVLENDSHVSRWIEETARLDHDQNMLPVILPLIKPGDWVVDGGAFIGDHTIAYLNAVGPEGRVFAFEPNIEAFRCLSHNCPRATNVNCGLGASRTFGNLVPNPNAGAAFLNCEEGGPIPIRTLDSFEIDRVDFMKFDLEGMELEALRGAYDVLTKKRPTVLLEINRGALARSGTTPEVVVDYLLNLDYYTRKVYDSDDFSAEQFDLLFLPNPN